MKKGKKTKAIIIVAVILVGVLLLSSEIFQPKAKTIAGVDYIIKWMQDFRPDVKA